MSKKINKNQDLNNFNEPTQLNNEDDFTNIIKETQSDIDESTYSNLARQLRGLSSSVKTITVVTAHNPCTQKLSAEENNKRNDELEYDLYRLHVGYRKVKGKYGYFENSFVINNLSKKEAIDIGYKYGQESIIFGKRFDNGVEFELIASYKCKGHEIGDILGQSKVFVNIQHNDDYYTEFKGRRFVIPFYDVEKWVPELDDEGKLIKDKQGRVLKKGHRDYNYKKKVIGDTYYDDVEWEDGKIVGSYYTPKNLDKDVRDTINKSIDIIIDDDTSYITKRTRRGYLINLLKKIN